MGKPDDLLKLARLRQIDRLPPHSSIGDFHGGVYECDHVSPWTKGAHYPDAECMLIAQDWASADYLAGPIQDDLMSLGRAPNLPTNKNLSGLLKEHFGFGFDACYATNLFVFAKAGKMSASVPSQHLAYSAKKYTVEEIRIVRPRVAICLGAQTFSTLRSALGLGRISGISAIVASPFTVGRTVVVGVAHPGALGMNNRGRENAAADWQGLATRYFSA